MFQKLPSICALHILWECTLSAHLRAEANIDLAQLLLSSPARAGIPDDWNEWPAPLRAFGIMGLETEIIENMKTLPTLGTRGPRSLSAIEYVQLLASLE